LCRDSRVAIRDALGREQDEGVAPLVDMLDVRRLGRMNIMIFEKRIDISILVICYASDILEYDRRTLELSNAPPNTD